VTQAGKGLVPGLVDVPFAELERCLVHALIYRTYVRGGNSSLASLYRPFLVRGRRLSWATAVRPADQEQAIEAVREWYAKHSRLPRRQEWERAARGRPTTRTIDRRWGWDKLMAKASGQRPAQLRHAELNERRRELLLRLRAARDELGHWPSSREWERATADHLSSRSYARAFGSWAAACRAAVRLKPRVDTSTALVDLWGWL
jgi:Homing endonuclease associated repeat